MVGMVLIGLAAGMSAVAVDAVVESASRDARQIILVGHTLFRPGSPLGPWILIALVAAAALAWAAVFARSRGRGLEQRMAEELDALRSPSGSGANAVGSGLGPSSR